MAVSTALATNGASEQQIRLDSKQTLRASNALLRKIQADGAVQKSSGKPSLLDDADDEDAESEVPVWLILTTKKHIIDKKRLKPGKIALPHPYLDANDVNLRICLITADPQRKYKDLVADPGFPTEVSQRIQRVIDIKKLKAKYKSFESRRQLFSEYDVFLADDRVVTHLPQTLGKVFYKGGSKRPIPISLEGRRQNTDEQGNKRLKLSEGGTKAVKDSVKPADVAKEVTKTIGSALVHLAPSTTTAIKVGTASMSAEHVQKNVDAVVSAMVEKYVLQKWSNMRAVHIKGPNTAALPIWLTEELWEQEQDVLDEAPPPQGGIKRKRNALAEAGGKDEPKAIEIPGPDGQMRILEKPASKRKSLIAEAEPEVGKAKKQKKVKDDDSSAADLKAKAQEKEAEKAEKVARKAALKKQKAEAKATVGKGPIAMAAK